MKVIYKYTPCDGKRPRLTIGKQYIVIGIDHENYRVVDDADEPILYPKEYFLISEIGIPSDWIKTAYSEGDYYIDPPECAEPGFYEDYFDGNEQAIAVFNKVIQRIKESG